MAYRRLQTSDSAETSFLLGPVASRSYLPDAISKRKSMLGQKARRVAYRIFYLPVQREEP
jgi:hypothetical protein